MPVVDPKGYAEIVVINPLGGHERTEGVTFDGVPLMNIGPGQHAIFPVPPGEHAIGTVCCPQYDRGLTGESGKRHFYVMRVGPINIDLLPINEIQSRSWLQKSVLMPLEKAAVPDNTVRRKPDELR